MHYLILYLSTLVVLIVVDMIWIMAYIRHAYENQLGHLLRYENGTMAPHLSAGIIVYLIMTLGILAFVLPKADSYTHVFLWGALLGVLMYGTYDFTNYAILSRWPLWLALSDVLWGGFLIGVVSVFALFCHRLLNG